MSLFKFGRKKGPKNIAEDEKTSREYNSITNGIRIKSSAIDNETSFYRADNRLEEFIELAPSPISIEQTGLEENLLIGLLLKHLHYQNVSTVRDLAVKLSLSGGIVQHLIDKAKKKLLIENFQNNQQEQMRFTLSSIGKRQAETELLKNGYVGSAPIPIAQYSEICKKQTNRSKNITKEILSKSFKEITFPPDLIEAIGPSLNSRKPILIYGAAGTGKSFFCHHLNLVFDDRVLIPNAIEVNNEIIQVYDPEIHHLKDGNFISNVLKLSNSIDNRWLICERPLVLSGGELSMDMLEVKYDLATKTYRAPLQLKANNGILLLDDLGRQKIQPKELFNRWIIPLEERRDFLSLHSGFHFELPFELLLLFSTNLEPTELVDDAFLRRLGYKINFKPLTKDIYQEIWFKECEKFEVECDAGMFNLLIDNYHNEFRKDYLPCYPRDLLCIVSDQIKFQELENKVTKELLDFAWHSYFVK